jgi:hypothetical protein
VDGLEGPAGAVSTRVVSWDGAAEAIEIPVRENLIALLSGFEYSRLFDLSLSTAGALEDSEGQTLRAFVKPGTQPSYPVRVLLDSKLPASATSGAQGWSLSIAHDGTALSVSGVTTAGTSAGQRIQGGFERHEVVSNSSGNGLVSAVVLSFSQPISLPPQGREHVLNATYSPVGDTSVEGAKIQAAVVFLDKLQGQGQPVNNVVTYLGESNRPLIRRKLTFDLEVGDPPRQPFLRSDSNGDGRSNIADAIWIVSELFFQGPETACFYAADANGDGLKDISDVAFLVQHQFLGGDAPPAPYPFCGALEVQDAGLCPFGSTRCPR